MGEPKSWHNEIKAPARKMLPSSSDFRARALSEALLPCCRVQCQWPDVLNFIRNTSLEPAKVLLSKDPVASPVTTMLPDLSTLDSFCLSTMFISSISRLACGEVATSEWEFGHSDVVNPMWSANNECSNEMQWITCCNMGYSTRLESWLPICLVEAHSRLLHSPKSWSHAALSKSRTNGRLHPKDLVFRVIQSFVHCFTPSWHFMQLLVNDSRLIESKIDNNDDQWSEGFAKHHQTQITIRHLDHVCVWTRYKWRQVKRSGQRESWVVCSLKACVDRWPCEHKWSNFGDSREQFHNVTSFNAICWKISKALFRYR